MNFQELFIQSKGKPFFHNGREIKMFENISILKSELGLKLEFISTNSTYKQGIVLQTKGHFKVNDITIPSKMLLWEDTAPKQVHIKILSTNNIVSIYNVWRGKDGIVHYWHNGGALFTEELNGSKIFYCNDGEPDDDFNDLIFKIELK